MTQVRADSQARPTIGDILLAHGFVSHDDLAAAIEEQQRSEQPLGQILVTRGAITRLELASALAEQWSMAPAPSERAVDAAAPMPSVVIDDDTYAVRVQSAVSDLARRVGVAEPLLAEIERRASESVSPQEFENRLAELRARVEASLDRVGTLESDVMAIAERLDEMTEGVEEAFADMQSGTGELAERLAAVAAALVEQSNAGELSALQDAVAALVAHPAADPALPGRVEELAAQLQARAADLDELRAELAGVGDRPSGEAALTPRLEELEERLESLAASSVGDDRLDRLEAQLTELAAAEARLVELEQRSATLAGEDALATLRSELDELAQRPARDPELEQRLEEQLQELAHRLEQARDDAVADVRTELAAVAAAVANSAEGATVAELEARLTELAGRPVADIDLAPRLGELAEELDRLRSIPTPEAVPDPRIETLTDAVERLASQFESVAAIAGSGERGPELEELRSALDELGRRRNGDEDTAHRIEALAADLAELTARAAGVGEIAARLDDLTATLETAAPAEEVALLRAQLGGLVVRAAGVGDIAARVDDLTAMLETAAPAEEVALLRAQLEELVVRAAGVGDIAARVDDLTAMLEAAAPAEEVAALRTHLEELACRPAAPAETDDLLVDVARRLETLEAAPAGALVSDLRDDLERQVREAVAATEERADAVAKAAESWTLEHARLSARLDELAGAGASPGAAEEPVGAGRPDAATERELERQRLAIERLGLHLGEHERALAEMMRSRGVSERLDQLAARVDDLAANGSRPAGAQATPAGGGGSPELHAELRLLTRRLDEAEAAVQADREKQLTRLERMASSIDWRLQRLEAGGEGGS